MESYKEDKPVDIIFIHGWGEDKRIWKDFISFLPAHYNCYFIDLGFIKKQDIGKQEEDFIFPKYLDKPAFYVTHSLGTMWALKYVKAHNIKALFAINGFANFTDFTDIRILKAMAKTLKRSPIAQMRNFWSNCFLPENMQETYEEELNIKTLLQGLDWLSTWDMCKNIQNLESFGVNIISLLGGEDLILPLDKARLHWEKLGNNNVIVKSEAGHLLPLTYPQWCVDKIVEVIN